LGQQAGRLGRILTGDWTGRAAALTLALLPGPCHLQDNSWRHR